MTGFVDGDAPAFVGVITNHLGQADLGDELCADHIGVTHCDSTVAQRLDQRLIEQPLDSNRCVAGGQVGDQGRGHR